MRGFTGSVTIACRQALWIGRREPGFLREHARIAGDGDADEGSRGFPERRLDAEDSAILDPESRDVAPLDDVDAKAACRARETPDDRVVTRDAAAPLHGSALDRVAAVDVQHRLEVLQLAERQHLRVHAVQADRVDGPAHDLQFVRAVGKAYLAALAQHDVVVQFAGEAFVKPERAVEELRAGKVEIVGADNLRVAAGIALADGAALEHCDVPHAVVFCEEIRRREPMPAATDDDRVVCLFERRAMQHAGPRAPAAERVPGEGEE